MELRQLRHFLALAETLNFGQAAERMHIAQPPLSVSIRKLEEEMGVKLFDRDTRKVTLTEAGRVALEHARRALDHVDETVRAARSVAAGESGRLRVAFVGGATFRLFPQALPLFRQRFPKVELELHESTSMQVLQSVLEGSIDIGILRSPLAVASACLLIPVEHDELVAILPPGHALRRRKSLKLSDLSADPFVMYSHTQAPSMHAVVTLACQRAGFSPIIAQEAVQIQTIVSLVLSGLGVALVPSACKTLVPENATLLRIADHRSAIKVGLIAAVQKTADSSLLSNFIASLNPQYRRTA
ncbi:MAG: LysR substrate-binding domain-containing protein [Janthinobacterium lividum]